MCPRHGCNGKTSRPDRLKEHILRSDECSEAALVALRARGVHLDDAGDISPQSHLRTYFIVVLLPADILNFANGVAL